LLDLLGADRRTRLAAPAALIEDGGALAAAGAAESLQEEAAPADRRSRKASPAERRAATAQVLAVWLDVARDLAVATRGGQRELRQHDLLDDVVKAASGIDAGEAAAFLGRLEAVSRALDAYANPELALDTLLTEWPRPRRAA
jgi:hypothetical protein